jgi:hypothetical protein
MTRRPQGRYNKIDARHDAELTALRRLIPWLSDSEHWLLRPALRLWCGAARTYLKTPQTSDDDTDFAMVHFEAYRATAPQHRRLVPALFAGIHLALNDAEQVFPGCCPRRHSHALALVLRRIGMTEGGEHV